MKKQDNLRQTTSECVYLVRRGHFRSRDKDGGHAIRSVVAENPTALSYVEAELLPIELYIAGIGNFAPFCCCNLDPMTFMYELDPYPLKIYSQTKSELSTSRLTKVIISHTHTDRHTYIHTV